jgi:hypothetical protein
MPGAKSARTVMIIVAIIVIGGLLAAMMVAPGAVAPR